MDIIKNNMFMGQLCGPFFANEELYNLIEEQAATDILYIMHLGISTKKDTMVYINGELYQIGKTGMYEVGNTKITSIYFQEDTDNNTIIDYTVLTKN